MAKPSAIKRFKDTFIDQMSEFLPEYQLIKPSPDKSLPSLIFKNAVRDDLTLYVGVFFKSEKAWVEIGWSEGEYPDLRSIISTQIEPLKMIEERGYCPNFTNSRFGVELGMLKRHTVGYVWQPWHLPVIWSQKHFERKTSEIDQYAKEAVQDVINYAIPYFNLLIAYRENRY